MLDTFVFKYFLPVLFISSLYSQSFPEEIYAELYSSKFSYEKAIKIKKILEELEKKGIKYEDNLFIPKGRYSVSYEGTTRIDIERYNRESFQKLNKVFPITEYLYEKYLETKELTIIKSYKNLKKFRDDNLKLFEYITKINAKFILDVLYYEKQDYEKDANKRNLIDKFLKFVPKSKQKGAPEILNNLLFEEEDYKKANKEVFIKNLINTKCNTL